MKVQGKIKVLYFLILLFSFTISCKKIKTQSKKIEYNNCSDIKSKDSVEINDYLTKFRLAIQKSVNVADLIHFPLETRNKEVITKKEFSNFKEIINFLSFDSLLQNVSSEQAQRDTGYSIDKNDNCMVYYIKYYYSEYNVFFYFKKRNNSIKLYKLELFE